MRRYSPWPFAFAACVSILVAAGCSPHRFIDTKASERVNAVLPRYLGPAARYETSLHSETTGALLRGHVSKVHIEGDEVQLQPNLLVKSLSVDLTQVSVDTHTGALTSLGSANFSCAVREGDLDRYVRSLRPDIPELAISLPGNHVAVKAKPAIIGIGAPVSVEGTLVPVNGGDSLNFEPDKAKIVFLPVPGLLLDYISKRLNPAVELRKMKVPIHIDRVDIHDGTLELSGSVAPDDILKAAGQGSPE